MHCDEIRDPAGKLTGFICRGGRRAQPKRCSGCGEMTATRECDGFNPRKKSQTCDAPVCPSCSVTIRNQNLDACPKCAKAPTPAGECAVAKSYQELRGGLPSKACSGALLYPSLICVGHMVLFSRFLENGGWQDVYSKPELPQTAKRLRFLEWMDQWAEGE